MAFWTKIQWPYHIPEFCVSLVLLPHYTHVTDLRRLYGSKPMMSSTTIQWAGCPKHCVSVIIVCSIILTFQGNTASFTTNHQQPLTMRRYRNCPTWCSPHWRYSSHLLSTNLQIVAQSFLSAFKLIKRLLGYPIFTLISTQSALQYDNERKFLNKLAFSLKNFLLGVTRKPPTASKKLKNSYNLLLPADLGSKELLT